MGGDPQVVNYSFSSMSRVLACALKRSEVTKAHTENSGTGARSCNFSARRQVETRGPQMGGAGGSSLASQSSRNIELQV